MDEIRVEMSEVGQIVVLVEGKEILTIMETSDQYEISVFTFIENAVFRVTHEKIHGVDVPIPRLEVSVKRSG